MGGVIKGRKMQYYVFCFNVSVNNVLFIQIFNTIDNLDDDKPCNMFREALCLLDQLVKSASVAILEEQVEVIGSLFIVHQLYNVWVLDFFKIAYLIVEIIFTTPTFKELFANLFASVELSVISVCALYFGNNSVLAGANLLFV